jgi:hypothetical protein
LIKNSNTGRSNDFGLLETYSAEDAEYLLRVATSPDFQIHGKPISATLTKMNRDSFLSVYGNIEAQEAAQAEAVQQQQAVQNYYKSFFEQLAKAGYYYDGVSNEYKRIEDMNSFEQVQIDPQPVVKSSEKEEQVLELQLNSNTIMLNEPIEMGPQEEKVDLKTNLEEKRKRKEVEATIKAWEEVPAALEQQQVEIEPEYTTKEETQNFYCIACIRKFKSNEELAFHTRYSNRHKYSLGVFSSER